MGLPRNWKKVKTEARNFLETVIEQWWKKGNFVQPVDNKLYPPHRITAQYNKYSTKSIDVRNYFYQRYPISKIFYVNSNIKLRFHISTLITHSLEYVSSPKLWIKSDLVLRYFHEDIIIHREFNDKSAFRYLDQAEKFIATINRNFNEFRTVGKELISLSEIFVHRFFPIKFSMRTFSRFIRNVKDSKLNVTISEGVLKELAKEVTVQFSCQVNGVPITIVRPPYYITPSPPYRTRYHVYDFRINIGPNFEIPILVHNNKVVCFKEIKDLLETIKVDLSQVLSKYQTMVVKSVVLGA